MIDELDERWDEPTFTARLRAVGEKSYHDRHPFHRQMNEGLLAPPQIRCWVANRFHYQRHLPMKDAAIIANCPEPDVRRAWRQRLIDQDGSAPGEGGIEAWLRLAEATGLSREETWDARHVVPGVRAAVACYVELARTRPWPVAVASSLTELFAPDLMATRAAAFRQHYTWIPDWGLQYFESRITLARKDSEYGLSTTLAYCDTPVLQRAAVAALAEKCRILWTLLDAIAQACDPSFAEPIDV
ncbi:MAG TPA: pyrroloquinoline-quinone synthase PqqC [Planctomycetaceae bacterium]|jgi:pyrroloquinoline-quinone synthase|nr:pyrroloquinoline-quinone synthase PqqC [Planctomycetaceae bacterium]